MNFLEEILGEVFYEAPTEENTEIVDLIELLDNLPKKLDGKTTFSSLREPLTELFENYGKKSFSLIFEREDSSLAPTKDYFGGKPILKLKNKTKKDNLIKNTISNSLNSLDRSKKDNIQYYVPLEFANAILNEFESNNITLRNDFIIPYLAGYRDASAIALDNSNPLNFINSMYQKILIYDNSKKSLSEIDSLTERTREMLGILKDNYLVANGKNLKNTTNLNQDLINAIMFNPDESEIYLLGLANGLVTASNAMANRIDYKTKLRQTATSIYQLTKCFKHDYVTHKFKNRENPTLTKV
ncbi:hypothetical protein HOD20_04560 [archaeon]|jgi:hypothetical protein|nr:hypothetical protein [archaeon]MBT4351778.1 hypothetical protein [archaeon]MBT4648316.1 hypothetical protein [archaeon]MBT6822305.1 hypothetical protein [archaeon]MBT7391800.1 hypothetical protein [archaeon]